MFQPSPTTAPNRSARRERARASRHLTRRAALLTAVLATTIAPAGVAVAATPQAPAVAAPAARPAPPASGQPDLGANVLVFDPSMPIADIQAKVDAVADQQVLNQFGTERYALLFKPGTYGTAAQPLVFRVGYYTEVAGLGLNPGDVTINGSINVYNRNDNGSYIALDNFWRSMSNLTVNVAGAGADGNGCHAGTEFWAVSQAAPMRRVAVNGGFSLMDYCTQPSYASGGFIADSTFSQQVVNGSQQQFYTRDSELRGGWSNGVWNQVFSGAEGAPAQSFPTPPYTTLETTPVSKEKPYLYVDAQGAWQVFVPSAQTGSRGTTWAKGATPGRSVPLSDFYVAKPGDSLAKVNSALAQGRNLLLTPGVYDLDRTIAVKRADTVVLGLGFASLTPTGGQVAMDVADVRGVDVAGVTFDAGAKNSPVLLRIGSGHDKGGKHAGSAADPTALQDVFFRIGGPHVGRATTSLEVNSDHVILDDIWAWRADHGEGVGWTTNTADHGVVVTGDDVTATGLFVEHYQKENVVWGGERGETVFFQNELPYDAPNQAAWRGPDGDGYPAYRVAPGVKTHQAWGLGSYIYTNVNPSLHATNAFVVPDTPGVVMHDLVTISLNKAGTIDHVINGVGAAVTPDRAGPENVITYSNGQSQLPAAG